MGNTILKYGEKETLKSVPNNSNFSVVREDGQSVLCCREGSVRELRLHDNVEYFTNGVLVTYSKRDGKANAKSCHFYNNRGKEIASMANFNGEDKEVEFTFEFEIYSSRVCVKRKSVATGVVTESNYDVATGEKINLENISQYSFNF